MFTPVIADVPNWVEDEAVLYAACRDAIARFSQEHSAETCSFFAFDSEPHGGYVILAFDTRANELQRAQNRQDYEVKNRVQQFTREDAWKIAEYFVAQRQSYAHSNTTGEFEFAQYADIGFGHWEDFVRDFHETLDKPDSLEALELHYQYFRGNVILLFWRVIERLIAEGAFAQLNLASPFRLGYNFHDDPGITVVRILNWPPQT